MLCFGSFYEIRSKKLNNILSISKKSTKGLKKCIYKKGYRGYTVSRKMIIVRKSAILSTYVLCKMIGGIISAVNQ